MSDIDDRDDRARDLAEYANAAGQAVQPQAHGHALVRPTSGIAERVIGAQPVAVHRDETLILKKLSALAAAAGSEWFYRFPVRKKVRDEKTGREEYAQDWIEGPSIKLALNVARIFGNFSVETREIDVGDAWVFYARGTDIETGFSLERAYRQRKSQTSMKTKDADRQTDITYQIGQSKAIRNVIVNSLEIYCDHAFEEARNSLVEKIGKDLPAWRERTLQGLAKIPVDVHRVERVVGRAAKDWLAPNIAQVIAMMKSIADGMATLDEVFPSSIEAPAESSASPQPQTNAAGGTKADAPQGAAPAGNPAADQPGRDPAAAPLDLAYRRGLEARSGGLQRRAIPPEYRDAGRQREAVCWQAGWGRR